jgi:hypothetical protein
MAGSVLAIHVFADAKEIVDSPHKAGHEEQ